MCICCTGTAALFSDKVVKTLTTCSNKAKSGIEKILGLKLEMDPMSLILGHPASYKLETVLYFHISS